MNEKFIPGVTTPRVPGASDQPSSAAHREAHVKEKLDVRSFDFEKEIAVTRSMILEKYSIPPENVLIFSPSKSGKPQRKIRAFSILSNSEKSEQIFYAEGHTAHAALNNAIVAEFGNTIGVPSFSDLVDQETFTLKSPWVIRKGFLDPFHNGFSSFPAIRGALMDQLKEHHDLNGLSEDEVSAIKKRSRSMPNWFLSGDSSNEES